MADALTAAARQVRMDVEDHGSPHIHRLSKAWTAPQGRAYRTRCSEVLSAFEGAILTTRPATCARCCGTAGRPGPIPGGGS